MLGASLALSEQTGESAFQTVAQFAFLRLLDCSAADPVETQAERELRAGVAEAYRRSRGRQTSLPAQAPGEESPINEILLQIYLEQALLLAELGVDLARAGRRVAAARRRLDLLKYAPRPAQVEVQGKDPRFLKSEYHRVASRLSLARGDVAKSLEECERALAFAPRSEVWLLLVRICLTAGRDGGMDPEAARERIEDALGRARDSDLRGLFTGELAELERRRALLDLSARR